MTFADMLQCSINKVGETKHGNLLSILPDARLVSSFGYNFPKYERKRKNICPLPEPVNGPKTKAWNKYNAENDFRASTRVSLFENPFENIVSKQQNLGYIYSKIFNSYNFSYTFAPTELCSTNFEIGFKNPRIMNKVTSCSKV